MMRRTSAECTTVLDRRRQAEREGSEQRTEEAKILWRLRAFVTNG